MGSFLFPIGFLFVGGNPYLCVFCVYVCMSSPDSGRDSKFDVKAVVDVVKGEALRILDASNTPKHTRVRVRKSLENLNMESNAWRSLTVILATYASTPLGSALITTIALILLDKAGFFSPLGRFAGFDVSVILGVIWSSELLGALGGGQGLSALIGGLGGLLGSAVG